VDWFFARELSLHGVIMVKRLALLIVCIPVFASAADPRSVSDLSAALQKAKVGTTIRVERLGEPVIGRFDGVSRDALLISGKPHDVEIPLDTVRSVSALESARGKGILWGATIGLAAGLFVASQDEGATITSEGTDAVTYGFYGLVGTLLGGAVGGVVGSSIGSWEPLYP